MKPMWSKAVWEFIRMIRSEDLPRVLEIEKAAYPNRPWTEREFVMTLKTSGVLGIVFLRDQEVLGYAVYQLGKGTRIRILNIAVDPMHARKGIGTKLVEKLKDSLTYFQRKGLVGFTSEWNTGTHLFLKSQGFKADKVFPSYYEGMEGTPSAYRFVYPELNESLPTTKKEKDNACVDQETGGEDQDW